MSYYIKAIGIKDERISIFEGCFPRMLLYNMCFKNKGGKVQDLEKGDKLVIYCIKNGIREFPQGGFIGIQEVLSKVYKDVNFFEKPWSHVVNIQPLIYSLRNIITLKGLKSWNNKSKKLEIALRARLQAIGGLWEIDKSDYEQFLNEFERKIEEQFKFGST